MQKLGQEKQNKRVRTAVQTAALMAVLTLIAKAFGFVREMFMAGYFGTSFVVDAYVMAHSVPEMIFGGIFMAIGTAYMPLFSKITESEGEKEGHKFTSEIMSLAIFCALIVFILGFIFSDRIVSIIAYNFNEETAALTSFYLKVTFAYLIFSSSLGIIEAFLRYRGVFLTPVVVGYLQNVFVIAFIIISAAFGYKYLAFGFLFGDIIRLLVDLYMAKKENFTFHFSAKFSKTAKTILALTLPVFIGSYINQINTFVDRTLASGLQVGSISALNYGALISNTLVGVTITTITTIIYPKMTQAQAQGNKGYFNEIVSTGFNIICIIAIPSSLGAMLYSGQIVQLLYERGAFDACSTGLTSTALFYYAAGILFVSVNQLFVQTFYALRDMKTPVICGAAGVAVNIVLNLILVRYMAHGGLALASSAAAMVNALMLYHYLTKKHSEITFFENKGRALKICIAAIAAVAASAPVYRLMTIMAADNLIIKAVQLMMAVAAAVVVYYLILKKMKIEELELLKQLFGKGK